MADPGSNAAAGGGILGRWENVQHKRSAKRIVECCAATPEYQRNDYLKPQHLPAENVDTVANYLPTSNLQETKFHRGFQRRHKSDIQPDAARLELEWTQQQNRDAREAAQVELAQELKDKMTFNILTGEGLGRDCEFRQVGKKIINPHGSIASVFGEHAKEDATRMRNSKHRFFEYPPAPGSDFRATNLFNEGLVESKKQSVILGYGDANPRTKTQSTGVADNFAHLSRTRPDPNWEQPVYGNHSQIILG